MTRNLENIFPFPAIVGQNDLKTVLILNAIYPAIGGVLIRGEKGTAKSTAARGLAMIMPLIDAIKDDPYNRPPDADSSYPDDVAPGAAVIKRPVPFVDLPLGATEDRVLGSLDFERALGEGKRVFQPGLLAAANRGILYIDEVNLLPPHLVDVLLDAAAMGVNTVQREGISITHPAQFTLIGTMNPEEGELRPQLLDRFGLMVDVAAPRDPQLRTEVVRRRIAYEENPVTYAERWMEQEDVLTGQIAAARVRLHTVTVSDEMLLLISTLCAAFDVDGLRADITLHKTARALAAWEGRTEVTADDIERAVPWVLAHRQRRQPFQQPGIDRDKLQNLLENQSEDTSQQTDDDHPDTETFGANDVHTDLRLQLKTDDQPSQMQHGRRNPSRSGERGRYGRVMSTSRTENLAIDATLRSAAVNGTNDGKPIVHPADYRQRERTGTVGTLILFIVDASGSMAARKRMSAVKGAVLSLLGNAYQHRDHVGVIAFRGSGADLLLPPTNSIEQAEQALQTLPTGGRTPLAHALQLAEQTLSQAQRQLPDVIPLVLLLTDGKANVPLSDSSRTPQEDVAIAARQLAESGHHTLIVDTEDGFVRMGRARELAQWLAGEYVQLDDLSADTLNLLIWQRHR